MKNAQTKLLKRETPVSIRMPQSTQKSLKVISELEEMSVGDLLTKLSQEFIKQHYPQLKSILEKDTKPIRL